MCRENQIMGFPSIRIFRKGRDEITVHGMRDHESYRGDRTTQALLDFADSLVPSAGQPHYYVRQVHALPAELPHALIHRQSC